jgi:SAM-dependent methyltransferase
MDDESVCTALYCRDIQLHQDGEDGMWRNLDQLTERELRALSPSPFVRRFGNELVAAAKKKPILHVACGNARNAILLAYMGANVIGLDIELDRAHIFKKRIRGTAFERCLDRIRFVQCDLLQDPWPSAGAIINVHFLSEPLLTCFQQSLADDGLLLVETVSTYGENYRELPVAGAP